MKTAIVVGATGLVGKQLTELLLKDTRFEKVKALVRRNIEVEHEKLEQHIVNFDEPDSWKKLVTGDVLYSVLGTTLRAAGSKDAQYKIDYTYQYRIAKIAASNNVPEYILISSAGSNPGSKIFYSRIKGELERDVQKLPFETIHIIRPGIFDGNREIARTGEKIGVGVLKVLSQIPGLKKLQPIHARNVAQAMINATFRHVIGIHSYTLDEVSQLAARSSLDKISLE